MKQHFTLLTRLLLLGQALLMETFYALKDCADDLEVLFFWGTVIWPRQILQLSNNTVLRAVLFVRHRTATLVNHHQLPLDQIWHQCFDRNQSHLLVFIENNSLLSLIGTDLPWPVLIALDLAMFLGMCQHDDERDLLLVDHAPEVLLCLRQWPLRRNKQLVVLGRARVNVVCVDVRIVDVLVPLQQAYLRVLEWFQLGISVELP